MMQRVLRVGRTPRVAGALARGLCAPETSAERVMTAKLESALTPTQVEVKDVSGGCGAFYQITVESAKFSGLPLIKQHRLVKEALADEIKEAHGVTVYTRTPAE